MRPDSRPTKTRSPKTAVPIQRGLQGGMARLRPVAAGVGARLRPVAAEVRELLAQEFGTRFRLATDEDPTPAPRRIAGICAWAASLGMAGLLVGAMALLRLWFGDNAGWYQPTVIAVGLGGIVCTIGAMAGVHRRGLPWVLLAAASAALVAALALTMSA